MVLLFHVTNLSQDELHNRTAKPRFLPALCQHTGQSGISLCEQDIPSMSFLCRWRVGSECPSTQTLILWQVHLPLEGLILLPLDCRWSRNSGHCCELLDVLAKELLLGVLAAHVCGTEVIVLPCPTWGILQCVLKMGNSCRAAFGGACCVTSLVVNKTHQA